MHNFLSYFYMYFKFRYEEINFRTFLIRAIQDVMARRSAIFAQQLSPRPAAAD